MFCKNVPTSIYNFLLFYNITEIDLNRFLLLVEVLRLSQCDSLVLFQNRLIPKVIFRTNVPDYMTSTNYIDAYSNNNI